MRERGLILGGLALLLLLLTFPAWYNLAAGTTSRPPDLKLPVNEKHCVAPVEYMRSRHMDLLIAWREQVVREGQREFTAFDGKRYQMSLSKTCMNCHTSKADFCDKCHNYAGVKPACWDCHIDPALLQGGKA
jgi:[DsrC]-trisulfide reductase subunit J